MERVWIDSFDINPQSALRNLKSAILLGTMVFALSFPVEAQQPAKIPQIGFVSGTGDTKNPGPLVERFRQALRDLGYEEGKNIVVEYRLAGGKGAAREAALAEELVRLNVEVLVATALPALRAAKRATKTIPIVMVTSQDPVATGLVDSLARPGGNITGVTRLTRDLSGKRLELFKEVIPTISRVGILLSADATTASSDLKRYEAAAQALKLRSQALEVRGPNPDFAAVFAAATKGQVSAFITISYALLNQNSKRIADLAIKNRLPSMFERSDYVETGGLVSYANSDVESYGRAAVYVDKILKGSKPSDLPVEQPTKFELVINLKTAKQIGVMIPPSVLARADKVIK